MKIIEQKRNPLFFRDEIKILIEAEKTPSYNEASSLISEKFNKSIENIAIKKVKSKFGRNTFMISAFVYDSKDDKEKIEKVAKKAGKGKEEAVKETKKEENKEVK